MHAGELPSVGDSVCLNGGNRRFRVVAVERNAEDRPVVTLVGGKVGKRYRLTVRPSGGLVAVPESPSRSPERVVVTEHEQ